MIRCIEVALSIPDNEARTALATLRRLGVPVAGLDRADLYRCDVAEDAADSLVAMLRGLETVFNPNKHVLRVLDEALPLPGEAWVAEATAAPGAPPAARGDVRLAGRILPGVRRLERAVAWRMTDERGNPASAEVVARALATLLCNSAFQKATTA